MRVLQVFCAVLATVFVLTALFTVQPAQAGVRQWLCGDGSYRQSCEFHDGWRCQDNAVVNPLGQCSGHGGAIFRVEPLCGDGIGDIGEQCDQGTQNSDNFPNACRTDCRNAWCGDGVVDNFEHCDDGYGNGNSPNSCRNDCTLPVCGDGIHDTAYNEACDDGNNNDLDGCKQDCTTCLQLSSNINVTTNTTLCGQVFNVDDYGPEGVIVIQYPGVTLDCDGATLQGAGGNVGIYVMQSDNVTVRNCTVSGYAVGVKVVDSKNLNFAGQGNNISGNTETFVLENSQMAPPQAVSNTIGGSVGSHLLQKQVGSQPGQTEKKIQSGAKTKGLVMPGGSERSKMPSRRPLPGKTGKQMVPFGVSPSGSKTVKGLPLPPKPQSLKPDGKGPDPGPLGTKSMPIDPYEKSLMSPDPLGQESLPVDPLEKIRLQVAPMEQK